jgi:hypothetical protein
MRQVSVVDTAAVRGMAMKVVGGVRVVAGLVVVISMIAAGGWRRSPWIVALATPTGSSC